MSFWLVQTLNGVTFGMVLFLIAAGLSLIFGLMRIINLAHGCFYLLGAYVALSVIQSTNSFFLALISGMLSIGYRDRAAPALRPWRLPSTWGKESR